MTDETRFLLIIVLAIVLIYYIYPNFLVQKTSEAFDQNLGQNLSDKSDNKSNNDDDLNTPIEIKKTSFGDNYFLDDGADGTLGLTSSMCSKACCSPQYPLPFSINVDNMVCNSKEEYIPSGYTCNNGWQDTGCLCMTKEQANFLGSRGKNA